MGGCRGANKCSLGYPLSPFLISHIELTLWKINTDFWTKEGRWISLSAPLYTPRWVRVSIYFLERGRGARHTWMDSFGEAFKHTYYVTAFAIKTEGCSIQLHVYLYQSTVAMDVGRWASYNNSLHSSRHRMNDDAGTAPLDKQGTTLSIFVFLPSLSIWACEGRSRRWSLSLSTFR